MPPILPRSFSSSSLIQRLFLALCLSGSVALAATAPLITQQPTSITVASGQPASFSVSVIGDAPLTYQWKKGGVDIPTATGSTYAIASAQAADAAAYTVTITNGTGNQISAPAVLVVGTKHILYVKANAGGSNNGSSWANAYTTLSSALSAALDGDEIWVAAGTYKPSTTSDRNAYFSVTKVLTILGGFAGTENNADARNWNTNVTILSGDLSGNDTGPGGNQGDNSKQVMVFEGNGNAVVDGFRITGGNCPTAGQQPDTGAGIFVGTGRIATVRNCTFYWNHAVSYGGGIGGLSMAALTVEDCYFHDNAAPSNGGGGMIAYGFGYQPTPHCIVRRSLFANNSGSGSGGLLLYGDLTSYVDNSVFVSNSSGGGLQSANASGAIRAFTSAPGRFWITNCTFSGNTNTRGTAGAVSASPPSDGNSIFANSIVIGSGSNPVSFPTIAFVLSDQTIAGTSNVVGTPTFENSGSPLGTDGIFGTRDDGFMLTLTSPGVNNASTAYTPSTDVTNAIRPLGAGPDRGAYEADADTDGDGILDRFETGTGIYVSPTDTGTSPTQSDTDGDGLTDGQEVNTYASNPNIKDSDGDGFEDGFEVFTGFNPTSSSSTPEALSAMLTAVEFRFNAANGVSYRIESSPDLSAWTTVENNITGTGTTIVRLYSIEGVNRKFYRARRN